MRAPNIAALAGSLLALCGSAGAADFAMMETAEPITPGEFKLSGAPVLIDRDRARNDAGFVAGLGYGLAPDVDLEAQVASYEDGTWFGGDAEWTAWRAQRMALSLGGGLHAADLDGGGSALGADGTLILSYKPLERLALSAALDAAVDDVNHRGTGVPAGARFASDGRYERYYAVPAVGYRLTRNLELLAEVGIGLNRDAEDYLSGGMSWYFR
jgi:hypothetical protein